MADDSDSLDEHQYLIAQDERRQRNPAGVIGPRTQLRSIDDENGDREERT